MIDDSSTPNRSTQPTISICSIKRRRIGHWVIKSNYQGEIDEAITWGVPISNNHNSITSSSTLTSTLLKDEEAAYSITT